MANKNSETQEDVTQLERQLNRIRYTNALGRRGERRASRLSETVKENSSTSESAKEA